MGSIDFTTYQRLSRRTAVAPDQELQRVKDRVLHWTIGMTNEAGEAAGLIKKEVCRGQYNPALVRELESELGDVLWYLTQLGAEYGLTLEGIADANIRKLRERHPHKFDAPDGT